MIGLPGDKIQIINGDLFINSKKIKKNQTQNHTEVKCATEKITIVYYNEILPNNKKHQVVYFQIGSMVNSDIYTVPNKHYFLLGDNRDCSRDSRFLSSVGYVHENNLVGKARVIFFSNDTDKSSFLYFWNWKNSLRFERFFNILK